jgi:hypothetical protein
MNDNDDKLSRLIVAYYKADRQYEDVWLVFDAMRAAVPDADEVDIARAIRTVAERALAEVYDRIN